MVWLFCLAIVTNAKPASLIPVLHKLSCQNFWVVLPSCHVSIPFIIAVKAETMDPFSKTGSNETQLTRPCKCISSTRAKGRYCGRKHCILKGRDNGADGVGYEESACPRQWEGVWGGGEAPPQPKCCVWLLCGHTGVVVKDF